MSCGQDLAWSLLLLFAGKAPGPEELGAVRFGSKEALVLTHHSWTRSDLFVHGKPQFQALVPLFWGYPHTAVSNPVMGYPLPAWASWHLGLCLSTTNGSAIAKPKAQG